MVAPPAIEKRTQVGRFSFLANDGDIRSLASEGVFDEELGQVFVDADDCPARTYAPSVLVIANCRNAFVFECAVSLDGRDLKFHG